MKKIVYVVAVFANRRTRLERILRRHRQDDVSSMQELIMRDELSQARMIMRDTSRRIKDLLEKSGKPTSVKGLSEMPHCVSHVEI